MEFKLSVREQDALRKLASLGSGYRLLHGDCVSLMACGLIERSGNGAPVLTYDGRKYLRTLDLELVHSRPDRLQQKSLDQTRSGYRPQAAI